MQTVSVRDQVAEQQQTLEQTRQKMQRHAKALRNDLLHVHKALQVRPPLRSDHRHLGLLIASLVVHMWHVFSCLLQRYCETASAHCNRQVPASSSKELIPPCSAPCQRYNAVCAADKRAYEHQQSASGSHPQSAVVGFDTVAGSGWQP